MKRRFQNTIRNSGPPLIFIAILLLLWQGICQLELLPTFMLPSPARVARAFVLDFPRLMENLAVTLWEAFCGLGLSVAAALVLALLMDANCFLKQSVTPVLLLTQTMPTIAIAPLLVLWMGQGAAPKIVLVFLTCFFPLTVGLLGGLAQADEDAVRLLQSMGARKFDIYRFLKLPGALASFFSGLKISVTYSVVGAVIAEWLGGNAGLGVYMIRVKKSYSFDKMFAVILLVAVLSMVLVKLTELLEKRVMPWRYLNSSMKV